MLMVDSATQEGVGPILSWHGVLLALIISSAVLFLLRPTSSSTQLNSNEQQTRTEADDLSVDGDDKSSDLSPTMNESIKFVDITASSHGVEHIRNDVNVDDNDFIIMPNGSKVRNPKKCGNCGTTENLKKCIKCMSEAYCSKGKFKPQIYDKMFNNIYNMYV